MTPTTELVKVAPDESVQGIQQIFESHDFHHLPVVERGEKLIGIISKEDFLKVAYVLSLNTTGPTYSQKEYQRLRAKDIMTAFPMTLDPDDTIGLAADIFLANKFHALPIVEDDQLMGLITSHDLLRFGFNSRFVKEAEEQPEEGLQ